MLVGRCLLLTLFIATLSGRGIARDAPTGLRAPAEFTVTQFAGDELAHDINTMTLNAAGEVVVSGPGFIKTLLDTNGDEIADEARLFAELPRSGARGMVFVGRDLYVTGDSAVMRFSDTNGDGQADGPPEVLLRLKNPEHGANGLVRGPDGWLYLICGNDAGVTRELAATHGSPVKAPQSGALLRLTPDGLRTEIVADGFRNVYDVDFNAAGHAFTVDSDGERDHHLPWYAPTRLFDIAQGRHHGWVNAGWQKSWNRPGYYFDVVDRLVEIGRGSPTGVVVYRHQQFPPAYQSGVFSCCWTLGRVYFFPLEPDGASYRSAPQTFLETEGEVGFAPVDLAVTPEGDLLVAIGGRRTRGGVFRVRHNGNPTALAVPPSLEAALAAPQPLTAWSRSQWEPLLRQAGEAALLQACTNPELALSQRIRGLEVLVDLFQGIPAVGVELLAQQADPEFLARLAWALSRSKPSYLHEHYLQHLTQHEDPRVARAAWEGLAAYPAERMYELPAALFTPPAEELPRVRMARLTAYRRWAKMLPMWLPPDENLTSAELLLRRWALGELHEKDFAAAAKLYGESTTAEARLVALRLMAIALGDWIAETQQDDVLTGYQLRSSAEVLQPARIAAGEELAATFPTGDELVDLELARLLGGLQVVDDELKLRIAEQWTSESALEDDLHYLFVMAQLPGPRDETTTARTAAALVGLQLKMADAHYYPSRNWPLRVADAYRLLLEHDPRLAEALLRAPAFGLPEHALFAAALPDEQLKQVAARKILELAQTRGDEALWTSELVELVGQLPAEEALPALRNVWGEAHLQDALTRVLARHAQPEDRLRLLDGLTSTQPQISELAAVALSRIPPPEDAEWLLPVLRTMRRYQAAEDGDAVRRALNQLLVNWTSQTQEIPNEEALSTAELYARWVSWVEEAHPETAAQLQSLNTPSAASWQERLKALDWSQGDATRGETVFQKRACHRCHQGSSPLGPDLAGAAQRLSRPDLFAAIVDPHREVAPLYEVTQITTSSGKTYRGLIVYESPEGTLIQTTPDTTLRVAGEEILGMHKVRQSLMPTGLLDDATDADLVDLYAYLRTLQPR